MSKYPKIQEPVFVTRCISRNSRYGGDIYEIHFKGVKTQTDYKTYCDPQNNNYRNWSWIIDANERKGIVLSNLKLKEDGLVNADSAPRAEYIVTKEELADCLAEFWDNQSKFNQLFGA